MKRYAVMLIGVLSFSGSLFAADLPSFKGLIQYDTGLWGYSEKEFGFRRLETDFIGNVSPYVAYRFNIEYASGAAVILDGYAELKMANHQLLRIGKTKAPLSLDLLQASTAALLPEFGFTTFLTPNRDTGFLYIYKTPEAEIDLGILAGAVDGASMDNDVDHNRVYVGRFFIHPMSTTTSKLGLGIAGDVEDRRGSSTTSKLARYGYQGYSTFFTYSAGVFANGAGYRLVPQGYFYSGPIGVFGEYALTSQAISNGAITANLRNSAWQVSLQWVLTGENATFELLSPKHPLKEGKGVGAWQVGIRYGEIDFDDRSETTFASTAQTTKAQQIGLGVNWIWTDNVKWTLGVDQLHITAFNGTQSHPVIAVLRTQVAF